MMVAAPAFAQSPPPAAVEVGKDLLASVTLATAGAAKLSVTTPGWKEGADIDFKYTQYQGNAFPGLEWTKGPAATKSYAIIMQDSDFVARGSPILHWSVVNIPATVTKLPAGMKPEEIPAARSTARTIRVRASPISGRARLLRGQRRYHIQVLAIDTTLSADFAPKSYAELIEPLKGHVIATGDVVGLGQVDPSAPPPAPRPPAPAAPPAPAPPPVDHSKHR